LIVTQQNERQQNIAARVGVEQAKQEVVSQYSQLQSELETKLQEVEELNKLKTVRTQSGIIFR
jgi:hypothetical protein